MNRNDFDAHDNATVVAGAVMLTLHEAGIYGHVEVVETPENAPYFKLRINPSFMQSPYYITIERDASAD